MLSAQRTEISLLSQLVSYLELIQEQAPSQPDLETSQEQAPLQLEGIRPALRSMVNARLEAIRKATKSVVEQAFQKGQWLAELKGALKTKEFRGVLDILGLTSRIATKYINFCKTFADFELSQIDQLDITTLFTLCGKTYRELVERLNEMGKTTQAEIESLMKQARSAKPRRQREDPVTGWVSGPGGSRHFAINLHDETTGMTIERIALERQELPQRTIATAIASYDQLLNSPQVEPQPEQFIQKVETQVEVELEAEYLQDLEAEVEPEPELEELKTEIINKSISVNYGSAVSDIKLIALSQPTTTPQTIQATHTKLQTSQPVPELDEDSRVEADSFNSWEDFARAVKGKAAASQLPESVILLGSVKHWKKEEKQNLSGLLTIHLNNDFSKLGQESWIPNKLLEAALKQMIFLMPQFVGDGDTTVNSRRKFIHDCKFAALIDFGTDREKWVFKTPEGKQLVKYSRLDFRPTKLRNEPTAPTN